MPSGAPRPVPKASITDVVPRRTLVVASLVVALVVLGTVLAFALSGGDGDGAKDNKGGKGSDKASSSGASAGGEGKGSGAGEEGDASDKGGKGSGQDEGSGKGSGDEDEGEGDGPERGDGGGKKPDDGAASTYKHSQGFSVGLPKGWKYRSTDSAGARFSGPDGQKLLIGWTTSPKDDPVADWRNQERGMRRAQYDRIRIEKVDFRGWKTADWEFTYVDGGTKYRSVDRGFVVNGGLGYGMMYTAEDGDWKSDKRRDTWRTLTRTFKPKS